MADSKTLFLVNPRSGGPLGQRLLAQLKQEMADRPTSLAVMELRFEDLDNLRTMVEPFETVVIGGGDGTVSSVLARCVGLTSRIGVLPLGTGNDLARELGLLGALQSKDGRELSRFYKDLKPLNLTLYELSYGPEFQKTIIFSNYVSFGFDAQVVSDFDRSRRSGILSRFKGVWINRAGYAAGCLRRCLFRFTDPPEIKNLDRNDAVSNAEGMSVIFSNIRSIMGMGISNTQSIPGDNKIECLLIKHLLDYSAMLFHYQLPFFHPLSLGSASCWQVSGLTPDICVQVDGEPKEELKGQVFRIKPYGSVSVLSRLVS